MVRWNRRAIMYTMAGSILCFVLLSGLFGASGAGSLHRLTGSSSNGGSAQQAPVYKSSGQAKDGSCIDPGTQLHLSDGPYENYFYADCHSSSQVVATSPLPDSDLTIIGPRLLIAWPAGNSGIAVFFSPQNGINGTLSIKIGNDTDDALQPVYQPQADANPIVGVSGSISFNDPAVLKLAILGSIRTIRDFVEGNSVLDSKIQSSIRNVPYASGSVAITRTWLDEVTQTTLSFTPAGGAANLMLDGPYLYIESGTYDFSATFNYPQLTQLTAKEVIKPEAHALITQDPDQAAALSFLSYTNKLLAGAWRFLTYFGRDSMISLLLMQPILSEGQGGAVEAVIAAVLERVNKADGSVCHEETIGDYATYMNQKQGKDSNDPQWDYKMVDTDFFLPIVVQKYFVETDAGKDRIKSFFSTNSTENPDNAGVSYRDLLFANVNNILSSATAFADNPTKENLIHLKEDQIVGNWRDSTYGIGGGRIPYDVNTALVPAALRAIASLSENGFFPEFPDWAISAEWYAQKWEDETLRFFKVDVSKQDATSLVQTYVKDSKFEGDASVSSITGDLSFYGLALDGNNNQEVVRVMNTDDCFRLFLLSPTNQDQLGAFLSQVADHIVQPFPVGLSTPVGLLVANPAYGGDPNYAKNFSNKAYHGTVVWSWQLAMMAAGLERQLSRCSADNAPAFCGDKPLYEKVLGAYNHLWDLIEKNSAQLGSEVWSWTFSADEGGFKVTPLGSLPPPEGGSPVESDIRQLWSLTFLAVKRNQDLR